MWTIGTVAVGSNGSSTVLPATSCVQKIGTASVVPVGCHAAARILSILCHSMAVTAVEVLALVDVCVDLGSWEQPSDVYVC